MHTAGGSVETPKINLLLTPISISIMHPESMQILETPCTSAYIGPRALIGRGSMERLRVGLPDVMPDTVRAILFYEFEPDEL